MSDFGKIGQSVAKILRFFNFSEWQVSPSWIFKFVKFNRKAQTHHHAKCRQNRSSCFGDIAIFWIFKMAAAAILDFEKVIFYWLFGRNGPRRISMPNFIKIGQSVAKILRFFDFSRWRPPPSWIVEFTKFYWLTVAGGTRRITLPNFIKIGRSITKMLQFLNFQVGRRRHLGFLKSRNFIGYRSGEGRDVSACQTLSKSVKIVNFYLLTVRDRPNFGFVFGAEHGFLMVSVSFFFGWKCIFQFVFFSF